MRHFGRLTADWLYRGWAIDRFCDAESVALSAVVVHSILFRGKYVCFAQFSIFTVDLIDRSLVSASKHL